MHKKTLILPVLAAAAAIAVAGCGSSSSDSGSGSSSGGGAYSAPKATATAAATAAATTAKAPADSGGALSVNIANFAFAPADIQAKVGQKITFTNQDSTAHTATATAGATFDSGSLDQGKSFSFTPTKAGTIKFMCSFHPNMIGTITVS